MKRWRLLNKKRKNPQYRDMFLDLAIKHIELMDKHMDFKNEYIVLQKKIEYLVNK